MFNTATSPVTFLSFAPRREMCPDIHEIRIRVNLIFYSGQDMPSPTMLYLNKDYQN